MMLEAVNRRGRYLNVAARGNWLRAADHLRNLLYSDEPRAADLSSKLRCDVTGSCGSSQQSQGRGFERLAMLWQALVAIEAPPRGDRRALTEF